MSSSMIRGVSGISHNSLINIEMRENAIIDVSDSSDDSDDNTLHIVEESLDESIEMDDSDEKAIDLSTSSRHVTPKTSEETSQRKKANNLGKAVYSAFPKHATTEKSKLKLVYQQHHYGLKNANCNERSLAKPVATAVLQEQNNGFLWTIPIIDINNSLPSISDDPVIINESFIYRCEFCSEQFSSDQLLIDHCARMHTKDIKCQYCEKTFYWEKDLHFHMRKHIKKGRGHKCQICTGLFAKGAELKEHMKVHDIENAGAEGSYPCNICDRKFKTSRTLQEHKRRFSHKQCEVCLEYFSSNTTLLQHFSVHVTQVKSTYSCDQCDEVFSKKVLLKIHRDKHRLYVCELCSAEFRRKDDIKCHLRLDCTKKSLFNCSVCSKSFLSECSVNAHMNVRHYGKNKCEFCSERFLHTAELVDHLKYHDIEHPYQCQICLSPMSSKRIFNFHLKSHNEKTKYKCERCCRWFSSGFHLQNHIKKHAKDTFKCTICTMTFSDLQRLEQHSRNHEENEFQCDICKQSFRTRHLIFLHMIDSHQSRKKCHICDKEFKNQRCLMAHLKSHYVKVEFPDEVGSM